MIKILIADDHAVVREGVKYILSEILILKLPVKPATARKHWKR